MEAMFTFLAQSFVLLKRTAKKSAAWLKGKTARDAQIVLIILFLALLLRIPFLSHPGQTLFDEVIYTNFAIYTEHGVPFFDIHPPLAHFYRRLGVAPSAPPFRDRAPTRIHAAASRSSRAICRFRQRVRALFPHDPPGHHAPVCEHARICKRACGNQKHREEGAHTASYALGACARGGSLHQMDGAPGG